MIHKLVNKAAGVNSFSKLVLLDFEGREVGRVEAKELARLTGTDLGEMIEDFVNYSNKDEFELVVKYVCRMHRTLQQKFFELVLAYISEHSKQDTDLRNEYSVNVAKKLVEAMQDKEDLRELGKQSRRINEQVTILKINFDAALRELEILNTRIEQLNKQIEYTERVNLKTPFI